MDQLSDSRDSCALTISIKKTDDIPASTWKTLQGAYHHSERSTIASGRHLSSPVLEAHYLELCTLMMKSMTGLANYVKVRARGNTEK